MTDNTDLVVIKRNGSTEVYDESKIKKIVLAAGVSDSESQEIANIVTDFVKKSGKITTLRIRAKVLEELLKVNEYAAGLFEWYEKHKDEE